MLFYGHCYEIPGIANITSKDLASLFRETAAMADSNPDDELDWVKVRDDLASSFLGETTLQKAKRKIRENPFVPLGALATTAALFVGIVSFYRREHKMQQYMMRARVGAQAFTIVCMIVGFIVIPRSNQN